LVTNKTAAATQHRNSMEHPHKDAAGKQTNNFPC
jgi:hypothetical protein